MVPNAMKAIDLVAGLQRQAPALQRIGSALADLGGFDLAAHPTAVGCPQIAEAGGQLIGIVVVDEGPTSLPPRQQAFGLHQLESLAHRTRADAALPRPIALV